MVKICIDDKFYNEMLSAPKTLLVSVLTWVKSSKSDIFFKKKKNCDEEVFLFFFCKVYHLILDRNRFVLSGAKHVADPFSVLDARR